MHFDVSQEVLCGRNDNAVASPFSCMLPLAMLHAGARGETASALNEVLGLGPNDKAANDDFRQLLKMHKVSTRKLMVRFLLNLKIYIFVTQITDRLQGVAKYT